MEKIRVLAIAGVGRSGSTLLERFLSEHDNVSPIGEFAMLWGEMQHDFLCSCGQSFFQCSFWHKVFDEAFGGFRNIDSQEVLKLRQSVDRNLFIPLIQNPSLRTGIYQRKLFELVTILRKIYLAISKITNNAIILDSSKSPAYFHILSLIPEVDLSVIHLVRDSRAVAYSWQKKKLMTYSLGREQYIIRQGSVESSIKWNAKNIVAQTLKPISASYVFIRYEDFVDSPAETIQKILVELGEQLCEESAWVNQDFGLKETHGILGNPTPRSQTKITIRPDLEWKEKMSLFDKGMILALTWPLLLKYGYFEDSFS